MGEVVIAASMGSAKVSKAYEFVCTNPVRVFSNGSGSLGLYWDPVPGATGYRVVRIADNGDVINLTPKPINPRNPIPEANGGFRYVVSGLSNGVRARFRVVPVGTSSPGSSVVEGTPGVGTIRYASGTPAEIVADALALQGAAHGTTVSSGGDITVVGANGEVYEGFSDGRPAIRRRPMSPPLTSERNRW